MNKNNWHRCN